MMNKKRLAALALSAVMATSTMSIPVYAADFSDGATAGTEVQVQSDFTSDAAGSANVEVQVAEPAEETVEAVGDQLPGAATIDERSIVFYYEEPGYGTVMMYKLKGSDEYHKVQAVKDEAKSTAATCIAPEKIWLKATVDNKTYYSTSWFEGESALGESAHDWDVQEDYVYDGRPTHNHDGFIKTVSTCKICGTEKTDYEKAEPIEHTWSTEPVYVPDPDYANPNVKTDDDGYVVFNEKGEAVLVDDSKDGYYEVRWYCTSSECEAEREGMGRDKAYKSERKVEYAKTGIYAMIIDYDTKNIRTDLTDGKRYYNPTQQLPLDEDDIELKDCRIGGWYTIEYYNKDGKPLSREEKLTVNPHHYQVFTTAEFENPTDAGQCTVSYDDNGKLVVKNNSCYRTIPYNEVSHCKAAGCYGKSHDVMSTCEKPNCNGTAFFDKVEKEATPAGVHVIRQEVYNEIERQMNDRVESKLLTYAGLLKTIARFDAEEYVKLSAAPDCEVGGTVTVSYICMLDKETVVKTQEVEVVGDVHKKTPAVRENYVAPTCDKAGTYDSVIKCAYCGKELSREEKQIPRLTHTNEVKSQYDDYGLYVDDKVTDTAAYLRFDGDKVVDINGEALKDRTTAVTKVVDGNVPSNTWSYAGKYAAAFGGFRDAFAVSVKVYTECAECGGHEIALNSQGDVTLKIVDVKQEAANGKAGSITLEATYKKANGEKITETCTVPYFSNIEAYNGRLEEQPETPDEKLNGLHWDEDGECRYYVDGEFQKDFSGILEYEGKSFVLNNGVLCRTASGLNLIDDEWYYLTEGRIRTDVTQVVMYDGEWFYVTEGKLDTTVDDLVSYDGETFVYVDGRYAQEGNGLWIGEDGVWYFLSNGRVAKEHTGLAMYDNEWFYVVNGKLAVDFNGTVDFEGGTFKVVGGMVKEQVK